VKRWDLVSDSREVLGLHRPFRALASMCKWRQWMMALRPLCASQPTDPLGYYTVLGLNARRPRTVRVPGGAWTCGWI
jgi:hypothetical protein